MSLDLVTIDDAGHQLVRPAANAYALMLAYGCPPGVTSAYRPPQLQQQMRDAYEAATAAGNHVAYVATVAASGHPLGTRLDLPEPARSWVRDNGVPFGWWWGENTSEPWHFWWRPELVTITTPPGTPAPITEDDLMLMVSNTATSMTALLLPDGTWGQVETAAAAQSIAGQHIPAITVDPVTFGRLCPDSRRRA